MGNEGSQPGTYEEPVLPEGVLEVRLSVYKIKITGSSFVDTLGSGILALYHSGIVVAGREWAFGGHDAEGSSGVYVTRPEQNPDFMFYQRVIMGQVQATMQQANMKLKEIARSGKWSGTSYDLTAHNCNHFTSDVCWLLLKKRPPAWINQTADQLERSKRRREAEEVALADALAEYRAIFAEKKNLEDLTSGSQPTLLRGGQAVDAVDAGNGPSLDIPGEKAFQKTFWTTFDLAWDNAWQNAQETLERCPEEDDPEALRQDLERDALDCAILTAKEAAEVVAAAARIAAVARAAQPPAGIDAWDEVWRRESAPLVKAWREAAVDGRLNSSDAEATRMDQVQVVLDSAASAAAAAAAAATQDLS